MDRQNKKEEITTIPELAEMIKNSFQGNQDYMDKRFDEVKNELKGDIKKVDERLVKVERKLNDFIDEYDAEKLPMRVEYIENIMGLPKK